MQIASIHQLKRRRLVDLLKKQDPITCLQETYFTGKDTVLVNVLLQETL